MASNGKWTAMHWSGTATLAVFAAEDFKKCENDQPLIKGHNGEITDCAFSPFADDLLATSSNDCTVKLWYLDGEKIKDHITKHSIELTGHAHKVLSVNWHHICKNTLATSSFDNTVKVWDVENQVAKVQYNKVPG